MSEESEEIVFKGLKYKIGLHGMVFRKRTHAIADNADDWIRTTVTAKQLTDNIKKDAKKYAMKKEHERKYTEKLKTRRMGERADAKRLKIMPIK